MAHFRHLRNAPVREAIIELRASAPSESFRLSELGPLRDQLRTDYPQVDERVPFKAEIELSATGSTQSMSQGNPDGLVCVSGDRLQLVQFTLQGFSFHRFKPYLSWDTLLKEARRLWQLYESIARVKFVTRVGVRYINEIQLPDGSELDRLLAALPAIPRLRQGQDVASFASQVSLRTSPLLNRVVTITQITQRQTEKMAVLLLDIDAYRDSVELGTEDAWDEANELRALKNDAFFSTLTDAGVELFA